MVAHVVIDAQNIEIPSENRHDSGAGLKAFAIFFFLNILLFFIKKKFIQEKMGKSFNDLHVKHWETKNILSSHQPTFYDPAASLPNSSDITAFTYAAGKLA